MSTLFLMLCISVAVLIVYGWVKSGIGKHLPDAFQPEWWETAPTENMFTTNTICLNGGNTLLYAPCHRTILVKWNGAFYGGEYDRGTPGVTVWRLTHGDFVGGTEDRNWVSDHPRIELVAKLRGHRAEAYREAAFQFAAAEGSSTMGAAKKWAQEAYAATQKEK